MLKKEAVRQRESRTASFDLFDCAGVLGSAFFVYLVPGAKVGFNHQIRCF